MKKISSLIAFVVLFLFAGNMFSQSITGVWETIDDKTGDPKSHVEIYKKGNKYYGKVVKLLPAATTKVCNDCPGDKKGKNLLNLDILWDMKADGAKLTGGEIVDPADGSVYRCKISLDGKNKLAVRGYIGISLLGRTQYWKRVK